MGLNHLLHFGRLVIERRRRCGRLSLHKEVLVGLWRNGAGRCARYFGGSPQALAVGHHRNVAGNHVGLLQRGHINSGVAVEISAFAEVIRGNRSNGLADARICHSQAEVRVAMRKTSVGRQRRNSRSTMYVVDVCDIGDIGHVGDVGHMNAIEAAAIPRKE
jgi:hypothetical protein